MANYPFKDIEKKWQKKWEEKNIFKVTEDSNFSKDKRLYVLDMFPYPSGNGLHVGHPEGYTATDIYSRYKKMNGFNVLHPMGFDSFGLPAENYAIKTGTPPGLTTNKNIENFRRQIKALGFCYDWDREVITSEKEYYKWTQWLFLQLYKKGLAYESKMPINWCSSCKTGLANEEVVDGKCERCGSIVHRRPIRQWVLKITDYAEKLLSSLDSLDWPESVKSMQSHWIGKSNGAYISFKTDKNIEVKVYTTRPDTIFGLSYLVLSPEYPDLYKFVTPENKKSIDEYVKKTSEKSDLERTGLQKDKTGAFTGSYAINPVNGKKVPIWISDYVLMGYGTGAVMGVPAHDSRDFEFAKKFNLEIIYVLKPSNDNYDEVYEGDGVHINSGFLDELSKDDAIKKSIEFLESNNCGEKTTNYRLRDWIFSRQRYWGEPIPLVHCPKCGVVPLDEKDLPLTLPKIDNYQPTDDGYSPLEKCTDWVNTTCPICYSKAKRETNTMPQWAGSCWYYLRYLDPHNDKEFASKEKQDYWLPVDLYIGGAEHAVLHLLYSRFWHKVFYDLGLVNTREPFTKLVNQGLITSFAYQRKNKVLVPSDEVYEKDGKFYSIDNNEELTRIIAKMSKSLKNVINPDDIINTYGADSLRLYEMFMGPLTMSKPWDTKGIIGISRFLDKVYRIAEFYKDKSYLDKSKEVKIDNEVLRLMHKTIKKVTEDIESLSFNTGISALMVFTNELLKLKVIPFECAENLCLLLSIYAPHLCEEFYSILQNKGFVYNATWPVYDSSLTVDEKITIGVQVNGKLRGNILIDKDADESTMLNLAKNEENVKKHIFNKEIVKEIVIKNKIVNIVVK